MKKYEAVFILDPRRVENNGEAFSTGIEDVIRSLGGTLTRSLCLEKRVFARPIGKHKAGLYWDYVMECGPEAIAALQDKFHLNQTVLRLAVFEYEDGQDDDVFKPRDGHDRLVREESFQDSFDRDERPFRSYREDR